MRDVMMGTRASCGYGTNPGAAIEIMWNRNCGILPIVHADERVVGVLTDRDLCIALATQNRLLGEVTVSEVASGRPPTCKADDEIRTALAIMVQAQVRRLPVVSAERRLEGILSMDDVALHAEQGASGRATELSYDDVAAALKKLYARHLPQVVRKAAAAQPQSGFAPASARFPELSDVLCGDQPFTFRKPTVRYHVAR